MSELPSWVKAGVKCTCIATPWFTEPEPGFRNPIVGDILTVRDWHYSRVRGKWGLSFTELSDNDIYGTDNFRPIVTRTQEQDVTAIRKLVDEMPITERLDRIGELL